MAASTKDTKALTDLIASTLALLGQFAAALSPSADLTSTASIPSPPNPLDVLRDSAKLIKAHTTKLSLLAINKPFTPSAITKVLKELSGACLPAMMSAAQICEQDKGRWSSMMSKEVQARVRRVFKEMGVMLEELQSIAGGNTSSTRRDSLSSTGVVWESCDACIELSKLDVAGLAMQKAEQYRDTIKDAITELQEWKDGEDLDSEGQGDGLLDSDDEGVDGDRDSIEDIFNAANSMPKDRPELKALVEDADAKLKKIVILYDALVKRRIKTFKNGGGDANEPATARLDGLMQHLKTIPHQVDEMASFLYDLDESGAKAVLSKCVTKATSASAGMESNWNGEDDASSEWLRKFSAAVK